MHRNKIKPQNKSVQLTRHGTAETTLNDIQKKFGSVFLVFSTALFHCENCADFLQIKMAVREHFKQSLHYVNHSIYLIETDYPQASIHPVSFVLITQMIDNLDSLNNQSLEQSHFLIEEIEDEIRALTMLIDQCVFIIRDCPLLEPKKHILLLAQAMTELFQLQSRYIYPYRKDLIPAYLGKIDFVKKLDENK